MHGHVQPASKMGYRYNNEAPVFSLCTYFCPMSHSTDAAHPTNPAIQTKICPHCNESITSTKNEYNSHLQDCAPTTDAWFWGKHYALIRDPERKKFKCQVKLTHKCGPYYRRGTSLRRHLESVEKSGIGKDVHESHADLTSERDELPPTVRSILLTAQNESSHFVVNRTADFTTLR